MVGFGFYLPGFDPSPQRSNGMELVGIREYYEVTQFSGNWISDEDVNQKQKRWAWYDLYKGKTRVEEEELAWYGTAVMNNKNSVW